MCELGSFIAMTDNFSALFISKDRVSKNILVLVSLNFSLGFNNFF